MSDAVPFSERLAPDTVARLERAAEQRLITADILWKQKRRLAALYLYGYSAEICLSAAYYRSAGFAPHIAIDRDMRKRRMAQARQMQQPNGSPLMNSDPHPLVGWARFLEAQRQLVGGLSSQDEQRLREAIRKATLIYNYWRPELRYKTTDVNERFLREVQGAAKWLIDNQAKL
jgi:hypothetical protein